MHDAADESHALQAWLEKLQATDGVALDEVRSEIIRHSCDRLEKLTRTMLRNYPRLRRWEQTGDVLQNALLRLHQALVTIRPSGAQQFFGLAAMQIRRELIDMTRHHFGPEGAAAKHQTDSVQLMSGGDSILDGHPDVQSEPSSLEEWTAFHEAVQRLPDPEREVFDLYWYEGFDQKTIARLLNVTDRTVKNRWRSAKLAIRDGLMEIER
ncbi:RNA polymerase sigma factor [Schlesneria paludicola]|uniref:RNA polymerase sigma factor n=1 Tax=Schlesneria paludicola TaxID=360056 RepID=UPI00029A4C9A|nr:sigma-70 family RNA polymerase sigma factor [Schlesneria paludicola]